MRRVIYIAGRYRHSQADGTPDWTAMDAEIQEEQAWAITTSRSDCAWIAPLTNSVCCEDGRLSPKDFIERDLAIIHRLTPGYDLILMRPGWDAEPESVGARAEHEAAIEHGLEVLHGKHGAEAVLQRLSELDGN